MRFFLAAILAPVITFALLVFMANLITNERDLLAESRDNTYFDLLMPSMDESVERKNRHKPKPPEPKPQQVQQPVTQLRAVAPNSVAPAPLPIPNLTLSTSVSAMSIPVPGVMAPAAPVAVQQSQDTMAIPLFRQEPRYPNRALRLGKQGYVVLAFSINESGRVSDIEVLEANPRRLFEKEAIRALKKWKYKPMVVNGKPQVQPGQKIRLDFKLES